MNKSELWHYTVEYVLSNYQNRFMEKHIRELIDEAGGNITVALGNLGNSYGWFGGTGPDRPYVRCMGGAPQTPVSAWSSGKDAFFDTPDLQVTWREIFEYVKSGKVPAFQMSLFD